MSAYEDAVKVGSNPRFYSIDHPKGETYFLRFIYAVGAGILVLTHAGLDAQDAQITTGSIAPEIIEYATRIEHAGMGVVHIADMVGADYLED